MVQNAKKRLLSLEGKILLGLSGGPDSMCLCTLLRECKKKFHIAHIDHALIKGSDKEKDRLALYARMHNIPFHSITLEYEDLVHKNLEDSLRNRRIDFFKKVMKEQGLDVLLLGHQKDERAETMVKRFFEGGSIFNLSGIKTYSEYEGMKIFRPMLNTTKKAVIDFLDQRGIEYFVDPTNLGTGNLRGKMRVQLLPTLEKEFGKNIISSVCDLGDQMEDVRGYIYRELSKIEGIVIPGAFGLFYPYKEEIDDFLYTQLIFKGLKERGISLSREQRTFINNGVKEKIWGKSTLCGSHHLHLEKVGVFLIDSAKDKNVYGIAEKDISWMAFWQKGKKAEGFRGISLEEFTSSLDRKRAGDYHRKANTPLCLRGIFPIPLTAIRKKIKITAK